MSSTDRYPNYFSGLLTLSAANTFTTQAIRLPINRLGRVSGSRGVVLEFMKIRVLIDNTDLVANGDEVTFSMQTGPPPTTDVEEWDNPDCIANIQVIHRFTTSGSSFENQNYEIDLTEGGFGQLVAAETLHVSGNATGQAAATHYHWRVYYRFVSIPAMEMMGILQSQGT